MTLVERIADFATRASSDAKRFLEAGAYMVMIESEGITENVKKWRTDVPARIIEALGLEKVMFEAADPEVFAWYIKNYGPRSISSWTTARSCSLNACGAAFGAQPACGAGS